MQFGQLRRRELITLLAGAAAWQLAAHAQQRDIPTIGFLSAGSTNDSAPVLTILRQGLKDAGLVEGYKVRIEFRWAEDRPERLPALAAELVERRVAVIFAVTNAAAVAAKSATTTIPIVFAIGGDPVKLGLVSRIEAPGGNATGITARTPGLYLKRLDLLHQLDPKAKTIGILINSADPTSEIQLREAADATAKMGFELRTMSASNDPDLDPAFQALVEQKVDALLIPNDAFFNSRRHLVVGLAARYSLPTLYPWREYVEIGGLMSFGPNLTSGYRVASMYVSRILHGANPENLPVLEPAKFNLVINSKTAQTLGLTIPKPLFASASQVIH